MPDHPEDTPLSWSEFRAAPEAFDALVAATPDIDRFCSSSYWGIPARDAFTPTYEPHVVRLGSGYAALAETTLPTGERLWVPLESMWLLGTPIIGQVADVGPAFAEHALRHGAQWDSIWLSGMQRGTGVLPAIATALRRKRLFIGPTSQRHEALIDDGFDAWFARRSAGFRKKTRQGLKRAFLNGLKAESFGPHNCHDAAAGAALFQRIHAIETRSWKGREGSGFVGEGMRTFYAGMLPRLAAAGALRAIIGTIGGVDACFIFGGVFAGTFRGLQMSFDDVHRHLELGNAMQIMMLQALADEGVGLYDLGSDMAYKSRWSDRVFETFTVVIRT